MNKKDETELRRLASLLSQIGDKTELTKEEKEALEKAALALSISFIHGYRNEIEDIYENLDDQLTADQKQYLRSLDFKND